MAGEQAAAPDAPAAGVEGAAVEGGAGESEQSWEAIRDGAVAAEKKSRDDAEKAAPGQKKPGEPDAAAKDRKVKHSEWQVYEHKLKNLNERQRAFDEKYGKGQQELQALEKRTTELDERAKLLDKLETDPKAFIEHFAKRVGMTPGKVVNALNEFFLEQKSPAELEIAKLRADMTEKEKRETDAKAKADADAAQNAKTARVQANINAIADYVSKSEDKFTFIPTYPAEAVANAAWARIEKHYAETGKNIPLDKILEILESEEEAIFLKKEERRKKRQSAGAEQVGGDPNRGGAAPAANHDAQQRPTTLNHRLAGQRVPQSQGKSDQEVWEESKRQAGIAR